MIQDRPVCFDCEEAIDSMADVVFAPPFEDEAHRAVSACFHGLCLMRWRERRGEIRERIRLAHESFMRHVTGECGCPEE